MNNKFCFYLLLVFFFTFSSDAFSAVRYAVDADQSFIRFAAKMCEPDILKGEFGEIQGEVLLDEDNLENSKVKVTVNAAAAVFDHEYHKQDHIDSIIKSEKILNVADFPVISFESTAIKMTGGDNFKAYGQKSSVITAIVKGNLTLVGQTRPIELEATFHDNLGMTDNGRELVSFSAFGKIRRSDFGVMYGLDRVGIRKMGDEVMVMVSITGNRKK